MIILPKSNDTDLSQILSDVNQGKNTIARISKRLDLG